MYKLDMPEARSRTPRAALIVILLLIVSVIALVILIGSQRPDSSTQAGAFEFAIATQVIASGEDLVVGINNATLYVPRDAIGIAGSIAIFPREPNLFTPPGDTKWSRPLVVNVEFRDENGKPVTNITFTKPAEICFKITADRWKDYTQHPNEYEVQTYMEGNNPPLWEPLSLMAYPDRSQLCGQTNHFSLFALATKPETTIPLVEPTATSESPPSFLEKLFNNRSDDQSGTIYEP